VVFEVKEKRFEANVFIRNFVKELRRVLTQRERQRQRGQFLVGSV